MKVTAAVKVAPRLREGATTYSPRLICERCGVVDFAGSYFGSHASALEAAARRADPHIRDHEREDDIAQDPFAHLT